MRTGDFQKKDGTRFTITPERLQHWANTFNQMRELRINVPICKDHQIDVDHTVGSVLEMDTDGSSLYAILEFPDERFVDLTKNNGVSIASREQLQTGLKTFDDAIEHVALTSRPLIPGLGGYSLVCSLNDENDAPDKDDVKNNDTVTNDGYDDGGENDTAPQNQVQPPKNASNPKPVTASSNPTVKTTDTSQTQPTPAPTIPVSGYALQRAMESVSRMFGVPIPPEATRNEEAAIVFLSTIEACHKTGIIQKQEVNTQAENVDASANKNSTQNTDDSGDEPLPEDNPDNVDDSSTDSVQNNDDGTVDDSIPQNVDPNTPSTVPNLPTDDNDGNNTKPSANVPGTTDNIDEGEDKKKKRTPGEDGIVASLNDYRRMRINLLANQLGVQSNFLQNQIERFCQCHTQEDYWGTLGEFESFQQGLECSLNSSNRPPIGTWTGPQFNDNDRNNNHLDFRKSIFEERGALRDSMNPNQQEK